ncbi:hypothetical protein F2Q70_00017567 [Brassica cretica]|uniref:Uncharacterized protein n=1 Tax=Brassica cretica TaxID=69181 RepID=A0A8S9HUY1_BRACR|nr:hypothetical protein F2Q70_00017567 [Brassica cretica]KAF2567083.1 hypothetical protein F2Q68_00025557 [Brassica cretica]
MEGSPYRKFSFSRGKGAVPGTGPEVLRSGEPGYLLAGTQRYHFPPSPRQDPDLRIPVPEVFWVPSIEYPGFGSRNRLQLQEKANCR